MKRLLIAGGSHSDIPLIRAAKSLGFHVTTGGNKANDIGHAFADSFVSFDYSNPEELADVARAVQADAICACCNDFSAISCSIAAHELGLGGHDHPQIATLIHHKDRWRVFAQANGVPSPRAVGCETLADVEAALTYLTFPLMIKPVDLTGGKGISRVDDPKFALSAASEAFALSKAKRLVVEEFISGTRHGFSCLLKNGRVVFHFSDDELYHVSEYLVAAARSPTSCRPESISFLLSESERVAKILRLVDGIFHVQFIERDEGPPVIIEVCRRAPGDLYLELVKHATGISYSNYVVSAAAGLDWTPPKITQHRFVTRHCLMADNPGTFRGFRFSPSTSARIIDQLIWAKPGDLVSDASTHKFGIVFVSHPSQEQMMRESQNLQSLLFCEVEQTQTFG
jgi:biotin carboxylase